MPHRFDTPEPELDPRKAALLSASVTCPDLERVARHWNRWRRRGDKCCLLWIDLMAGMTPQHRPSHMPALAAVLKQCLRATDEVSPVGERAIAVLLPAESTEAPIVVARLRPVLAAALGRQVPIGVASFPDDGRSGYELALTAQARLLDPQTSNHSLRT